jgi:hypothetical protein
MMLFKYSKIEFKEELTQFRGNESNNNSIFKMFIPNDRGDLDSLLFYFIFVWVCLLFIDEIKQVNFKNS